MVCDFGSVRWVSYTFRKAKSRIGLTPVVFVQRATSHDKHDGKNQDLVEGVRGDAARSHPEKPLTNNYL